MVDYKAYLDKIDELKTLSSSHKSFDPREHKDRTRAYITGGFLVAFFLLLGLAFYFTYVYNQLMLRHLGRFPNLQLADIKDIITLLISALGTPLGFVIGYYFKEKNE
jgi:zinc transporter ZupT